MTSAVIKFLDAHERYLSIDAVRTECSRPEEREQVYIEILKAYLEVQYRARVIAGLQFADGNDFSEMN